eukprot:COSAG06_NODE_27570_length_590_cov_2.116090_1_plen_127_part_01
MAACDNYGTLCAAHLAPGRAVVWCMPDVRVEPDLNRIVGGHQVLAYWEVADVDCLVSELWVLRGVKRNKRAVAIVVMLEFDVPEPRAVVRVAAPVGVQLLVLNRAGRVVITAARSGAAEVLRAKDNF